MEFVMKRDFAPIHPGEILLEEFLKPMGITQYRLAKDIAVPPRCINEIVQGKRAIWVDTALRLGAFLLDVASVLDQPSSPLRFGDRSGGDRRPSRS